MAESMEVESEYVISLSNKETLLRNEFRPNENPNDASDTDSDEGRSSSQEVEDISVITKSAEFNFLKDFMDFCKEKDEQNNVYMCKICKKTLSMSNKSAANLWKHLRVIFFCFHIII